MENEKFQELVLQQLKSINSRMDSLEKSQDILASELMAVKADVQEVKTDVQKIKFTVTRIEQDHGTQLGALMDGYKQNTEILDRHTEQLYRIEGKIESHDIQISVLDKTKTNKRKVK